MFKKLFGKNNKEVIIAAPITGKLVPLENVPDPVFSQRMMGDGLAIDPSEGIVVAPFDAKVVQVFPTKHAIGLKHDNGLEVLIHVGLETVGLKGEGFEAFVSQGDTVKQGDRLLEFNLDIIREKASSTVTPIILTNGDLIDTMTPSNETETVRGETTLFTIKVK
ncbi:PTS glucose transporter subunit IIA [Peribacillus sp. SCS-155]|uniref:PTS sugar transporter subunit IIA n=1 Tax=Peribacillus sedimenti TaxID=3115297 RepID=UPI0039059A4D